MRLPIATLAFLVFAAAPLFAAEPAKPVLLIVHGAWGGAWQFARIDPPLQEQGFDVRRITLTGLGERVHLATPDIGLATHIDDVVNVILFEQLRDVILVGHSYGGMVITGVAERVPDRIAKLVYLDAMLPLDGESVLSLRQGRSSTFDFEKMTRDGFVVPFWVRPDKPHPFDVPHPLKTFRDPITVRNPAAARVPGIFILTVEPDRAEADDDFARFAERARARGWPVWVLTADHNPHWRKPAETAALLGRLRGP